jgi:hypothetical protein
MEKTEILNKLKDIYFRNTCNADLDLNYESQWELGFAITRELGMLPIGDTKVQLFGIPVDIDITSSDKIKLWRALN